MQTAISRALRALVLVAVIAAATFATTSGRVQASTVLLPPTQITLPVGTSFFPGVNGGAVPANLHEVIVTIDVATMPVTNSMDILIQFQYPGDSTWQTSAESDGVTGGPHPSMHNPNNTAMGMGVTVDGTPYPSKYRFVVTNGPTTSPVTVSATTLP